MAYTHINFKTKTMLKQALFNGRELRVYNPGLGPDLSNYTGTVHLEGPHYPQPHKWYATVELVNGIITGIK